MITWPDLPPLATVPSYAGWGAQRHRLQNMVTWQWRLPAFQRERCWTAQRHADYLTSVLRGEEQTPIVAWEHQGYGGAVLCLDGQHRLVTLGIALPGAPCPPLRIRLADAVAEPGEADDAQTVALSRLCEFWRGRGRAAYEQRVGEGVFDRAFDIFARLNDLDFPLILNRERESAESWRRARDYFTRLNRSVPFTAAELADFDAFVDQQETP